MCAALSPFHDGGSKPHISGAANVLGVFLVDREAHDVSAGLAAHLGAALHAAVAADRHQSGVLAADVALGELQIDDGAHVVAAVGVLGDAHAPDDDGVARLAEGFGEAEHVRARQARAASPASPRRGCGPWLRSRSSRPVRRR